MKLIPLQEVSGELRSGSPLPWSVRDNTGKLLLAKGYMIGTDAMLQHIIERGMFVDADEAQAERKRRESAAKPVSFFVRWQALQARLATVLRSPGESYFLERLNECVGVLAMLSEQNADQLIYSIIRHDHGRYATYGTSHALHVATVCALLGRRMEWPRAQLDSLIGAALTMNVSIIDLQGQLAARGGRPTAAQMAEIKAHPAASAQLLRLANVTDREWLAAVEQHHVEPGGKGYGADVETPSEMSQMLRFIDIFTAKHAGRADRLPVPAQQAARDLYTSSNANPIAAMLIKEFGIFPPGCFVKLASGEVAIVIRRGPSANTPQAAVIAKPGGQSLATPIPRDTAQPEFAVLATVPDNSVLAAVPEDKLYQ